MHFFTNGDNCQVPHHNHSKNCGLLYYFFHFFCPTSLFSMNLVSSSAVSSGGEDAEFALALHRALTPLPSTACETRTKRANSLSSTNNPEQTSWGCSFSSVEEASWRLIPYTLTAVLATSLGTCSVHSPCISQGL